MDRILELQQRLNVKKDARAQNYTYRTLPDTLKALLPQLKAKGLTMLLPVELQGNYVIAHCIITDASTGELVAETTYPTKDENAMIRGGQGTGAACTYAKKGAIDSMFLLDACNPDVLDLDDHDALERASQRGQKDGKGAVAESCPEGFKELAEDVLLSQVWLEWGARTPAEKVAEELKRMRYWVPAERLCKFSAAVIDSRSKS